MENMKETLIFCFDGTCNNPEDVENYVEDGSITNIQKLHVLFGGDFSGKSRSLINGSLRQRSFYYKGVGTYGGWFRRLRNMLYASEGGDVKKILNAAIKDLKKHHREESHVLIFGFSRGAALARRFAAKAREVSGKEVLKIDFLGVFDTVAAISGTDLSVKTKPASDVVFEDGIMGQDVQKAVHLVALDENRVAFQPTLFDYDSDRITEVWFPGVHSDVGGGYWYDGLSDSALEYMIEKVEQECGEHVRILDPEEVDYDQLNDKDDTKITKDDVNRKVSVGGILHEHKQRRTSMRADMAIGITAGITAGMLTNLIVGLIIGVVIGVAAGVIVGVMARKMTRKVLDPRQVRIAGNPPKKEHPMVHKSVQDRYTEVRGYRPHALRDVKYFLNTDDKHVGEPRQGVSALGMELKTKGTDTK